MSWELGSVMALIAFAVGIWPAPPAAPGRPWSKGRVPGAAGSESATAPSSFSPGAAAALDEVVDGLDDVADGVLLLALALRSGRGLVDCLDIVADVARGRVGDDVRAVAAALRWGVGDRAAWQLARPEWQPAAIAWSAASEAGVAPATLLEDAAGRIREAEEERVAARVQRAAVLLVLPLGGLFLPGFVATTVVPVVLTLLGRAQG